MMRYYVTAAAVLILLNVSALRAASLYDSSYKWHTIKTENFFIHFHGRNLPSAVKISEIAEKHYTSMTTALKWKPWARTHIILVDSSDLANGWASPFPKNTIQIYLTRPYLDDELASYEDWLEMVFIHEFTHILNIDMAAGIPLAARYVPGRCMFPNSMLPVWAIEGSAVYSESIYNGLGRNNSSYTEMVLRTEIAEGGWKGISESSHFPRKWPRGSVPYLYGGAFVAWLEENYGAGKFTEYFAENSDNCIPYSDSIYPIPFFYNKDAKDVYGKGFGELWDEWSAAALKKHEARIESIRKKGLTPTRPISDSESDSLMPAYSPDGKYIFYIESHPRKNRSLARYSIEKKSTEKLCDVNRPSGLAAYGPRSVITADVEYHNSFSLFTEIFNFDENYKQTTEKARSTHISFSHATGRMAAASINENRYSLTVYEKDGTPVELIKNSDTQITFPAISPDGKTAAFVIKNGPGSAIVMCDISSKKFTRLTNDNFNSIHPQFTPDGKKIIFSSDRDGVYNIYEMTPADGAVRRVTSLIGGGFHPSLSPDGRELVFSDYGKNGHTVSVMNYRPDEKTAFTMKGSPIDADFFSSRVNPAQAKPAIENYNPLYSLSPPFIIPLISSREYYPAKYEYTAGFLTMGYDALAHHSYMIIAEAYMNSRQAAADISYTYSALRPDITFGYYDDSLFFGKDIHPVDGAYNITRTMLRSGYALVSVPWIKFNSIKIISLYAAAEKQTDDYFAAHRAYTLRKTNTSSAAGAGFNFDSTKLYPYSVSPENGRTFSFLIKSKHEQFSATPDFYLFRSEFAEYISAPGKSAVFMLRARGEYTPVNRDYLAPFSLGRFEKGTAAVPEDSWGLRGYPAGDVSAYRMASAAAEYRIPVLQADAGFDIAPVMFRDLWLNIFAEGGNLWNGTFSASDTKFSAGAELNIKFTTGYHFDIAGYIGYARGFSSGGEDQFYFAIGTFFEGAFKDRNRYAQFF